MAQSAPPLIHKMWIKRRVFFNPSLNKYIFVIASIGLPKVNLWVTKCVTKRPYNAAKTLFLAKHLMFGAQIYPKK